MFVPILKQHRRLGRLLSRNYYPRQWETIDACCQATLTVVSYNLLSDSLAQSDRNFRRHTFNPNPRHPDARCKRLLREIQGLQADIVCIQELDEPDRGAVFGRTMPGSATLAPIASAGKISTMAWRSFTGRQGHSKRRVCVMTAHVVNSEDEALRKLGQFVCLMAAAEIQLRKDPKMPLIFTGDFNTLPDRDALRFVSTGVTQVDSSHSDEAAKEFKTAAWEVRQLVNPSDFDFKSDELRGLIKALRNDLWVAMLPILCAQPVCTACATSWTTSSTGMSGADLF
ncbi:unnamed protein product [Mortierella alpina]